MDSETQSNGRPQRLVCPLSPFSLREYYSGIASVLQPQTISHENLQGLRCLAKTCCGQGHPILVPSLYTSFSFFRSVWIGPAPRMSLQAVETMGACYASAPRRQRDRGSRERPAVGPIHDRRESTLSGYLDNWFEPHRGE